MAAQKEMLAAAKITKWLTTAQNLALDSPLISVIIQPLSISLGLLTPSIRQGVLLREAQRGFVRAGLARLLSPGLFIISAIFCFNFDSDGLRNLADPYSYTRWTGLDCTSARFRHSYSPHRRAAYTEEQSDDYDRTGGLGGDAAGT